MWRRRLRKWAKWTCTLAAGAVVVLALFSGFYSCRVKCSMAPQPRIVQVWLSEGLLRVDNLRDWISNHLVQSWELSVQPSRGWHWGVSGELAWVGGGLPWRKGLMFFEPSGGWILGMSLAYPVLFMGTSAALLWYADSRPGRPGHCAACGYDRAGLASTAACPECGRVPASA